MTLRDGVLVMRNNGFLNLEVEGVGLWVWVAQVGLTRLVTQETHPWDVFP